GVPCVTWPTTSSPPTSRLGTMSLAGCSSCRGRVCDGDGFGAGGDRAVRDPRGGAGVAGVGGRPRQRLRAVRPGTATGGGVRLRRGGRRRGATGGRSVSGGQRDIRAGQDDRSGSAGLCVRDRGGTRVLLACSRRRPA